MISVAAIRMQQFGVQFYQASLTASDIDKLVRFEVLSYQDQATGGSAGQEEGRAAVEDQLGPARTPHRLERKGVSAPDHPQEDRRAGPVLRAVPPGARPAVDSRRRDHLVRREAQLRAGRKRLVGRPPEGAGARRHPARDRRAASPARAARRHRPFRRRAVHRAGDHFRSRSRRSHRPDVRHDQREAHAPQRVAPGVALGPPALSRRSARGRARRGAGAQRSRRVAARTARSSCSASARAASARRRSRRSSRSCSPTRPRSAAPARANSSARNRRSSS